MMKWFFAGGSVKNYTNRNFYLYNNTNYFLISPAGSATYNAYVWRMSTSSVLSVGNVESSTGMILRPVINLKSDVQVSGTGTKDSPFIVE